MCESGQAKFVKWEFADTKSKSERSEAGEDEKITDALVEDLKWIGWCLSHCFVVFTGKAF